MRAAEVLKKMEERNENRLMILYRDDGGKMRSLVYQDMMFFEPVGHHEYRMLGNPTVLRKIVKNIKSGEYKYVGKGKYSQPVKFTNVKVK